MKNNNLKLMVIGHARSGKDTASEYIKSKTNLKFTPTSELAAQKIVYPYLCSNGMGDDYATWQECFDDRVNHRAEWFNIIQGYNTPDKARFATEVYDEYDIYCGLRSQSELEALYEKDIVDLIIWIDRSKVVYSESPESFDIGIENADIIVDNNGNVWDMYYKLDKLIRALGIHTVS